MGNTFIQEHIMFGLYGNKKSSVIEFAPNSNSDKIALETAAKDWAKLESAKYTFANDIYDDYVDFSKGLAAENQHYLGLTVQEDTFEKTNPSELLGLAKIAHVDADRFDDSAVYVLDYIQTRPDCMHLKQCQNYKNVGQRLLDFVMYKFKDLPLVLMPTKTSVNFYLNNGFRWLSNGSDILILRR